jgi:hypothetical protein
MTIEVAGGGGAAHTPMIEVVNNDVPTDPVKLRKTQLAHADAAIASAKAKVAKLKQFVATAPRGRKEAQRAHLKGAEKALAEAIAAKERIS